MTSLGPVSREREYGGRVSLSSGRRLEPRYHASTGSDLKYFDLPAKGVEDVAIASLWL